MSDEKKSSALFYVGGVVIVLLVIAGVLMMRISKNASASTERQSRTETVDQGPRVRLTQAKASAPIRRIELQGEARPFLSVTIYAKVSGYLKDIRVDKGDKVKLNQVMGTIESPELDRQYDAAMADANYKKANAKRAVALAAPGVVSATEADTQTGVAQVAEATLASLAQQKSYEILRAPFNGTVTARYADPGALVQAATGASTGALPLVTISTPERLRVYVYVDQRQAGSVRIGDAALVSLSDRGDAHIEGRVARLSSELDPHTRMMLVEIDVDNKDGAIVPGSFVTVTLSLATPPEIEIPVEALVMHGKNAFVPVVENDIVHYKKVRVSDDDGTTVRIHEGLKAGENIALNLSDNVADGARVQSILPTPPVGGRNASGK
jgi:membrane fusion protein (multidrug efflux system)